MTGRGLPVSRLPDGATRGWVACCQFGSASERTAVRRANSSCFKDKSGEFRFHLKAANGEIIATSQGYKSKEAADKKHQVSADSRLRCDGGGPGQLGSSIGLDALRLSRVFVCAIFGMANFIPGNQSLLHCALRRGVPRPVGNRTTTALPTPAALRGSNFQWPNMAISRCAPVAGRRTLTGKSIARTDRGDGSGGVPVVRVWGGRCGSRCRLPTPCQTHPARISSIRKGCVPTRPVPISGARACRCHAALTAPVIRSIPTGT
jgi:hypothetical protein